MNLKESRTFSNLVNSFAGECMARTRYEFIEYGARMDGQKALASIIDGIVYNEFNHARLLYSYIQGADKNTLININVNSGYPFKEKWNLLDNLKFASEDEENEGERIYPAFAKIATDEGFDDIATLYRNLAEVEKTHSALLLDLYKQSKDKSCYKKTAVVTWKCPDCGFQFNAKEAFDECPLCHAKKESLLIKV
ncbi:MAG: hypothetical protein LBU04_01190 [Christensenellaceae bacterium]|jgi:rubrerythrin|nr:hypothetical protein [Christensenellaceae bacterium]